MELKKTVTDRHLRISFVASFETDPHETHGSFLFGFGGQTDRRETHDVEGVEATAVVKKSESIGYDLKGHVFRTVVDRVLQQFKQIQVVAWELHAKDA